MNWEIIIGLETHVQLSTVSKLFSGASTRFGALPNMQASVVDLALPGVLPVANRGAVERAILFGLAINARIAPQSVFARKHYFYPDLPKGYQISQHDQPVIQNGALTVEIPARGASEQKAYQKRYALRARILRKMPGNRCMKRAQIAAEWIRTARESRCLKSSLPPICAPRLKRSRMQRRCMRWLSGLGFAMAICRKAHSAAM